VLLTGVAGSAEALEDRLAASAVPTAGFPEAELRARITSYAVSEGDPFLLAYYVDDGTNLLKPPLYVVRYDRATRDLRRAALAETSTLFQGKVPMDCTGSALRIAEKRGNLFIETHGGPSAGCVLVLSPSLAVRAALDGWLLGLIGADWAIVRGSEVHFQSVHPLHVSVFDLRRLRTTAVYPVAGDPFRSQYSRLLRRYASDQWCRENNAACDPAEFDVSPVGEVAVNESAPAFAFEAAFDGAGFGDAAAQKAGVLQVVYVYRLKGGVWEHRELSPAQMNRRFGASTPAELVQSGLDAVFR
jgi:hypothetical protein